MKFNKLFETLSITEQKVVKFNFENIASFDDIPYRGSIIKLTDALGLETPNFKIIDSIENMNVLFDSADHI